MADRTDNRVRAARKALGYSQPQMAKAMGVSAQTLKRWEHPTGYNISKGPTWPPEWACRHAELLQGVVQAHRRLTEVLESE